ncbi:MAG: hypothetical protein FVQ83_02750 [Chloroflexi bacterium]|nr:hypothetical protein [Chloroflexota bacterium]
MKVRIWICLLLIFTMSCGTGEEVSEIPIEQSSPTVLPDPAVTTISAPDPAAAARAYLDAWAISDYAAMYAMLTTLSQDAFSFDDFEARYSHVAAQTNLFQVEYDILQSLISNPESAQVGYRVTLHSSIVGAITRETMMNLSRGQSDDWRVVWDDRLILPELAGGNTLSMEREVPSRGNIYDREGNAIAGNTDIVTVAVIPSEIGEDDGNGLVGQFTTLTGLDSHYISRMVFDEDAPYLLPISEVSQDQFNRRLDYLSPYYGMLSWREYSGRLYFNGGTAPQTTGWVGPIPVEAVDEYISQGYQIDDNVGRDGVEAWAESMLSGTRGGTLYVVSPQGSIVTTIASSDPEAAQSVYLTLDKDLQQQAQLAIDSFNGAIVVLERDTGRVLAMVSSPGFNPNAADTSNINHDYLWSDYVADTTNRPFFNRATMGQYPPGSIFKVITTAAALESGLYTAQSELYCGYYWEKVGVELEDWTVSHERPESGQLNLLEGVMRSCNIWFYEIGYVLYNEGYPNAVTEMARGFGLGSESGIDIIPEASGQVTEPDEDPQLGLFPAVQQAFGQGTTTVTPLQVAAYISAVGNGGTLYQPQLIEYVESTDGRISMAFEPSVNGTLPISDETLASLQTALRMVVNDARGTAFRRFSGFPIPVAGKTGTADVEGYEFPFAWFIGYTLAERPNQPDIAIAVIVENVGDGSDYAAPIFRRVAEIYFYDRPQVRYWWESSIGIVAPPEEEEIEGEDTGTP